MLQLYFCLRTKAGVVCFQVKLILEKVTFSYNILALDLRLEQFHGEFLL